MRLGLVARSDNSGLGVQTLELYRHMQPAKTMVVDISKHNKNKTYPERYIDNLIGDVLLVTGFPDAADIDLFLGGLDVVLIAESAYNPYLYTRARELGVKTAVIYNYEFFDWFRPDMPKPDMLIAPSKWHNDIIEKWCLENDVEFVYLHNPVNREILPFREITQARTFLHIAGRAASHDRNGTATVIKASKFLRTDAKIKIHFQGEQGLAHQTTSTFADYIQMGHDYGDPDKLSIYRTEYENYQDIYSEGDVLVLPRRYGGNCLPTNEALSIGMPVIMTNISPNKEFLPQEWLVHAEIINQFTPRTTIDIYDSEPHHLANLIDKFYNMSESEMLTQNVRASNLAESISWGNMKWKYEATLEELTDEN